MTMTRRGPKRMYDDQIVAVEWFTGARTCGFVLIWDKNSGYKCYLGPWHLDVDRSKFKDQLPNSSRMSMLELEEWQTTAEEGVIDRIRELGAKVSFEIALAVFPHILRNKTQGGCVRYDDDEWYVPLEAQKKE